MTIESAPDLPSQLAVKVMHEIGSNDPDLYGRLQETLSAALAAAPQPMGCGLPCGFDCNGACFEARATAATALDDPYAALSQHLHGDGDAPRAAPACATPACATPGCTNPPVIRFSRRYLCRDCYEKLEFSA